MAWTPEEEAIIATLTGRVDSLENEIESTNSTVAFLTSPVLNSGLNFIKKVEFRKPIEGIEQDAENFIVAFGRSALQFKSQYPGTVSVDARIIDAAVEFIQDKLEDEEYDFSAFESFNFPVIEECIDLTITQYYQLARAVDQKNNESFG